MDQVQYENEIKSIRQRLIPDYECILKKRKIFHNITGTNRPLRHSALIYPKRIQINHTFIDSRWAKQKLTVYCTMCWAETQGTKTCHCLTDSDITLHHFVPQFLSSKWRDMIETLVKCFQDFLRTSTTYAGSWVLLQLAVHHMFSMLLCCTASRKAKQKLS